MATLLRNWLLLGFSFGEAAWTAEFGFSWQTTVVGDPLYRPWAVSLEARLRDLEQRSDPRVECGYWCVIMFVSGNSFAYKQLLSVAHAR